MVDLVGGTYRISAPLTFYGDWSGKYSGLVLRGGTLVAYGFQDTGFALDFRQAQIITIEDVTIDMQHFGGCARFDASLQITMTGLFCLHYSSWGVLGDDQYGQGHELTVADSFFAEFMWGELNYNNTAEQNGTAIEMRYPDSNFLNIVIRCTKLGVRDLRYAAYAHWLSFPQLIQDCIFYLSIQWGEFMAKSAHLRHVQQRPQRSECGCWLLRGWLADTHR